MNKQHLRRPRIHRAFVKWFNNFAVPLRMTKINGNFRFYFENYPDCIFIEIFRHDLAVTVVWRGRWFDALLLQSTFPIVTRGGYKYAPNWTDRNALSRIFPSLEVMWQEYLFEPFLGWVNGELAPACGLQIVRVKGWREARLFQYGFDFPEDGKPFFEGDPEGYFECVLPLKPYTISKAES